MTITADIDLPIARTADAVWTELVALDRYPEWLTTSGVVAVRRLDDGPVAVGTRLEIDQQLAGRRSTLTGEVTALEPVSRLAFLARNPDGIELQADARLEPAGPTCRLLWSLRIGLPLRLRLLESMAAPEVRRAANADLLALKRRLETVAG